jgi:hypothetical protein
MVSNISITNEVELLSRRYKELKGKVDSGTASVDEINEYNNFGDRIMRLNEMGIENIEKVEKTENSSLVKNIATITNSDYIQIPGKDFVIAIGESDFNLNYEDAHRAVLKRGLAMPDTREFMDFHNYIMQNYKGEKPIFDASGNPISDKTKNDLCKQLTSKCWTWLNGKFIIQANKKAIEKIIGLDKSNNLIIKEECLENCSMGECYIDFTKLTSQGLPSINTNYNSPSLFSRKQVYFYPPRNGSVVRFSADFLGGGADLSCKRNPSYSDGLLGVRTIAREGLMKNGEFAKGGYGLGQF